jgi:hypothetical protein
MITVKKRNIWIKIISVVAIGFGLLTIKEGGAVLLGNEAALIAAGNYVPLVLWFNFFAGFAYVTAGVGFWMQQHWAAKLAIDIAVITAIVFVAFGVHIYLDGAYEMRTVIAMSLRTLIWIIIAIISAKSTKSTKSK